MHREKPSLNSTELPSGSNAHHNSPKPSCSQDLQNSPEIPIGENDLQEAHEPCSSKRNQQNSPEGHVMLDTSSSFSELLPTPKIKASTKPRRKTLSSSAQVLTKDLFQTAKPKRNSGQTSTPKKSKTIPKINELQPPARAKYK